MRRAIPCLILAVSLIATSIAFAEPPPQRGPAPPAPEFPFDAAAARRYQQAYAEWSGLALEFRNELGMQFVLIPPGTFTMGSPVDEAGRGKDEAPHAVTLTRPFYLSRYETTAGQFRRFVEAQGYKTDGERNGGGHAHDVRAVWEHRPGTSWRQPGYAAPFELRDEHPVMHVSHADSQAFCRWLATQSPPRLPQPMSYALPTEAQWEWACRAGRGTRFSWGADLDTTGKVINAGDQALKRTHPDWPREIMPMDDGHAFLAPVGSYGANAFALHDMLGNVWEFCASRSGPYGDKPVTDPGDLDPARDFAVRGGGWSNVPADARCATRNADPPHFCHSNLGFRVALVPIVAPQAGEILGGLREFYRQTARPDGSFQPGIDPDYLGMSDCAYSDLAAVTYAATIHQTFGWKLPHAAETIQFLQGRQQRNGDFVNVAGTVDPASPEGRTYNTTQGLVALHALGSRPKFDPLPVFEEILREDYKTLPAYSTSFFPLAYLCAGQPIPAKADRGIRALMVQDETGYMNNHIAATFHASHYYRLVGEETPRAQQMVDRILRDQSPDGSWLLNMPSRDRHATFDAVFTLVHEGHGRADCRAAVQRAADWALTCRNPDGGFGHFPGSPSDADAIYFQVGTLVLAGVLKPADPLPADPHLLSWGHLMPVVTARPGQPRLSIHLPNWISSVAFPADRMAAVGGRLPESRLAAGCADHTARIFDRHSGQELQRFEGHRGIVAAVCFSPNGRVLATGSYDQTALLWDAATGAVRHRLTGHRGAVLSVAFSPDSSTLATASADGTIKMWNADTGTLLRSLDGHRSWVNAIVYSPDGKRLYSGSSDGTVIAWSATGEVEHTLTVTKAEVRSLAVSPDGLHLATGTRYGDIKIWETHSWKAEYEMRAGSAEVWSMAFSPDATKLASVDGDWNRGGFVVIWDVGSSTPAGRLQHTGETLSVMFSPDGKSIAAGGGDKTLKIWDVQTAGNPPAP